MVQAEPRPAGSLRRRRGARPRLARLWRRCPSSPGLNFSSLSLHQHHVTSAHAIGWQLYRHLHIHGGARARAGGGKGGSGVMAGARAPHLSHTYSARPSAGSPAPRSRGRPARPLVDRPFTVGAGLHPAACPRFPPLSHRAAAASPRPAQLSMAGEYAGAVCWSR